MCSSDLLNRIIKLNLHKRFALAQVELFGRSQSVLFGICLEQDDKFYPMRAG